jgi:hypothetical protein
MKTRPRALALFLTAICFAAGIPRVHAQTGVPPDVYVEAYSGEQEPNGPTGSDFIRFFTPEVSPFLAVLTAPIPILSATEVLDVGGLYGNFSKSIRIAGLTQPTGYCTIITLVPGFGGITAGDNKVMIGGDLFYQEDTSLLAETGVEQSGLPTGVTFKNFYNMDGNDLPIFFATLQGTGINPGNSLALCTFGDPIEDNVIHKATTSFEYDVSILVQVGDSVVVSGDTTKIVKTITCLTGSKGTLADGRWRTYVERFDDGITKKNTSDYVDAALVRLTFTDGSEGLFVIPSDTDHAGYAAGSYSWTELPETGAQYDIDGLTEGSTITSFGLPSIDDTNYAVLANVVLASGSTSVTTAIKAAPDAEPLISSSTVDLIVGPADAYSYTPYVMASLGDSVPEDANGNSWSGVSITDFSDPVVGEDGAVACMVTLTQNELALISRPQGEAGKNITSQVSSKPFAGIEFSGTNQSLSLLANVGAIAPDVTGTGTVGHWSGFTSLVLPAIGEGLYFEDFLVRPSVITTSTSVTTFSNTCGPIFVATLKVSATDGVNASNDLGMWAVNGEGVLQLIFRTGQTVTVNSSLKTVRTFTALDAAPGSLGSAMGYNQFGEVAVIATFTDGSTAMVWLGVPFVDIGG